MTGVDVYTKELDPTHRFYTKNGIAIKSLEELSGVLESMSEESYEHHVTYYKNDFAKWVREVFAEEELALALFESENREEMIEELKKFLKTKKSGKKEIGLNKEEKIVKRVFEKSGLLEKLEKLAQKELELVKREESLLQVEERLEQNIQEHKQKEIKFSLLMFVLGVFFSVIIFLVLSLFFTL